MLAEARQPVMAGDMDVSRVELVCSTLSEAVFPESTFDLIYSIGVLGEHCPLDVFMCRRVYRWLRPGGVFYFTAVDRASKREPLPVRARIARVCLPILPLTLRRMVGERVMVFYVSRDEIESVLDASGFAAGKIERRASLTPGWTGAHFECTVWKS